MYKQLVTTLASTGGGTQDITFAENWTPKAAIFFFNRINTSLDTFQEHYHYGIGFTDGTNSRCMYAVSADNVTNSDCSHGRWSDSVIAGTEVGAIYTESFKATFSQWITGSNSGVRINWSDAPSAQFYITVVFIGGSDISCKVDHLPVALNTTGNKSYTGSSFQPEFLFGLASPATYTASGMVSAGGFTIGVCDSDYNQWSQTVYSNDGSNNASTRQVYSHTKVGYNLAGTALNGYFTLTSFNSNGFTINVGDAFALEGSFYFLLIRGAHFSVGNATEPGSVSTQQITNNKNNEIVGIFGVDTGTAETIANNATQTIGIAVKDVGQKCLCFDDVNASALMVVVSRHDSNQVYINMTANATATSSTLDDEADISEITNGSFTMNWTNVGNARPYRYFTLGTAITSVTKTLTLKFEGIGQITKTLTLLANILKEISKSLTLRQDIRNEISKSTTLKFNLEQQTTKILNLLFDIEGGLTSVTKTLNLLFDITFPVTKDTTLRFDVLQGVSKTLTLLWDEIGQVVKTLTLRFNELQEVSRQLTLRFDELMETIKSLTVRQDIWQEVTKTTTLRFDVLKEVMRQLTLRQDIIAEVTRILTLLYDVESATLTATKSLTLIFSGIGQTTKSTTIRFDVNTIITRTLILRQDIRTEIERLLTLKFNTQEEVTKSTTIIFNVIQEITKSLTLRSDILMPVTKSLTLRNNILIEAMKSLTLRQDIIAEAVRSLTIRFDMGGMVVKSTTLRFDIIAETTKSLTLKFNTLLEVSKQISLLFSIVGQTTKSLTLPFNVEAEVTKTLTLIQHILNEVLKTTTIRFDVLQAVSKSLTLRQDIQQETTKTLTLRQNILQEVEKDITLLFQILQEVPVVSKTLRFDVHQMITKQLTLLADIQQTTIKQVRIRFDIRSILVKNMAEKMLDAINNRYIISSPSKTQILWHEWYDGQADICISAIPMVVVPITSQETIIYKKRSYVCALHIFYRSVSADAANVNTPAELVNLVQHITNTIIANRYNPNFLNSIDPKAIEVKIRAANYVPEPEDRNTTPSPKVYHFRYICEIIYHKLVT